MEKRNKNSYTIEYIKSLGKNKSKDNLSLLLELYKLDLPIDIRREIVSSIGRQDDFNGVFEFLSKAAFSNQPMELIYQMYRTCLYKEKQDKRFEDLGSKILNYYNNEVLEKMKLYKQNKKRRDLSNKNAIKQPIILIGDTEHTLSKLPENSIQLMFTSPPYYNAREYSDYHSYKDYLQKMKNIFISCYRVIEEGRFLIVNVSPVICKRPGREFESIRYPIHFDFHRILEEAGFYFIDEILWIKPEPTVPNRVGGYLQTKKPLSYKPNCISESILVYRKKCSFLLDKNIKDYGNAQNNDDEKIDTTNCWYISPTVDKDHPAVFPEELCKRVLKYYSFEGDVVLDPFAGSGTLGRVAIQMKRIPVMCEINESFAKIIEERSPNKYEIYR